jgi:hypothetical protein
MTMGKMKALAIELEEEQMLSDKTCHVCDDKLPIPDADKGICEYCWHMAKLEEEAVAHGY